MCSFTLKVWRDVMLSDHRGLLLLEPLWSYIVGGRGIDGAALVPCGVASSRCRAPARSSSSCRRPSTPVPVLLLHSATTCRSWWTQSSQCNRSSPRSASGRIQRCCRSATARNSTAERYSLSTWVTLSRRPVRVGFHRRKLMSEWMKWIFYSSTQIQFTV